LTGSINAKIFLIISGNIEKGEKCQDVRNNDSDELIILNLSGLKKWNNRRRDRMEVNRITVFDHGACSLTNLCLTLKRAHLFARYRVADIFFG
jgi:hypothetical protein